MLRDVLLKVVKLVYIVNLTKKTLSIFAELQHVFFINKVKRIGKHSKSQKFLIFFGL